MKYVLFICPFLIAVFMIQVLITLGHILFSVLIVNVMVILQNC